MNKLTRKVSEKMAKAAMNAAKVSANSTCLYLYHQPKAPAALDALRK